jgi:hypothetical protein
MLSAALALYPAPFAAATCRVFAPSNLLAHPPLLYRQNGNLDHYRQASSAADGHSVPVKIADESLG